MKKIILAALILPLSALAQTYPSPTFNSITLQNPLSVSSGGSGASSSTGTGSLVLSTSPTIASPTVTGAFTATGLVTTADLATQAANTILANGTGSTASPTALAMPSCSTSSSALGWTSGTGVICNTSINAATLGGATFAAPGAIGSTTPGSAAFTTLSSTSAPTLGAATFFPTVATNTALQALSTATTSTVTRLGFTTAGDAPALTYTASTSACSLNSGAGDNGSQVQSANSKCWIANFPAKEFDVHEWGVTGNGSTDDTSAIQAGVNYAETNGSTLYFGPGTYKYSSISVTGSVHFRGASRNATYFLQNSTTNVGIAVNTTSSVFFDGVFFYQSGTPTTGAAISLSATSGVNTGSVIRDCAFATNWVGVETINAALYVIDSNYFTQYIDAGLQVQNQFNVDGGDSVVSNNIFSASVTSSAGILQNSSGGLKVIGNKLIGGGYGYLLQLAFGANTSDLLFVGNSVENQSTAGLQMSNAAGTGTFANVVITGNQFAGQSAPIALNDPTSGWLTNVTISGNTITPASTGTPQAIDVNSASIFTISGNSIAGQGGTSYGVVVGSSASKGVIGPNNYNNLTTNIQNSSTTTTVDSLNGTVAVTGSLGLVLQNTSSAISLTSGTPVSTGTVTLTPGTWEVSGSCFVLGTSTTTLSVTQCGVSSTSGALPSSPFVAAFGSSTAFAGTPYQGFTAPTQVFTVSSNTPVYAVCQANFGTSTATCAGQINALRVHQ